ncbi:toprim domain-containing protein (plasmid) [Segatella hominis]|uniref:toprim domain-containing protein n=1 Tax=Segatella hominis TaxID=2518605 RepID=UPI001C45B3C4|nr:toprim domain-containing protein [Segatella hominis]WOZ83118.1 toprim domain-containing protein [Segatella hominis]
MSLIHSQQVGGQDRCCIFEGFMDFLSYKTLEKRGDNVRNMTAVTLGTMYSGSFGSSSYWDLVCLLGL